MSGTTSLGFVYPTAGDSMCAAPGFAPPKTSVEVAAESVEAYRQANLATDLTLIAANPRVRVSRTNFDAGSGATPNDDPVPPWDTFDTVEYNVGTPTNLGTFQNGLILGPGLWVITMELVSAQSCNAYEMSFSGGEYYATPAGSPGFFTGIPNLRFFGTGTSMLFNRFATTTNFEPFLGGNFDPLVVTNPRFTYRYCALSALRLADYF